MNDQIMFVIALVILLMIASYYVYKIITIIKNRSIAKQKGEDIYYHHNDAFKKAGSEAFGCILQVVLIFFMLRNRLSYTRYMETDPIEDLWLNVIFYSIGMVVSLIKLIYIIIYNKLPFVITDKYFIINGSIHKSSKIFYSYLDQNMILAKVYYHGKADEILRISMVESNIIQVIRKHSAMKDISLISCIKDENDNNSSGY